jgi:hypothetical protein
VGTDGNSESGRRGMEGSSVGKRGYGVKGDESSTGNFWAAAFHHVTARSRLAGGLQLMNRLVL